MSIILEYNGNLQVVDLPQDPQDYESLDSLIRETFEINHFEYDRPECLSDNQKIDIKDFSCCCMIDPFYERNFEISLHLAIAMEHYKCINYILDMFKTKDYLSIEIAAETNNLDLVKFLHKKGFKWDNNVLASAIKVGNVEILKYLIENRKKEYHLFLNATTTTYYYPAFVAASLGQLECLSYIVDNGQKNGYDVTYEVINEAAYRNQKECLKYLIEKGFKFNEHTITSAVIGGSLDCVKYLMDQKCEFSINAMSLGISNQKQFECLKYISSHFELKNFDEKRLESYLRQRDETSKISLERIKEFSHLNTQAVKHFITENKTDCFDYILENKCNSVDLLSIAANVGNFEALCYFHEKGCKITDEAIINALYNEKNFDCVRYLAQNR